MKQYRDQIWIKFMFIIHLILFLILIHQATSQQSLNYDKTYLNKISPIKTHQVDSYNQRQHYVTPKFNKEDESKTYQRKYSYQKYKDYSFENLNKPFISSPVETKTKKNQFQNISTYNENNKYQNSWINRNFTWSSLNKTTTKPARNQIETNQNEVENDFQTEYDQNIFLDHNFDKKFSFDFNFGDHPGGDLLVGRKDKLTVSSTCGVKKPERYCIMSHIAQRKKCFICDNNYKKEEKWKYHGIENIIASYDDSNKNFWWQAENGVENVTIQFDLEEEFYFFYLYIVFQTFRPAAMFIERSSDKGRTWRKYQYFAQNCTESFPHVKRGQRLKIDDVTCDIQYSGVEPSKNGELVFRVLPPNIHLNDLYSEKAQNLFKITNLRINFVKLHTLGDNFLDSRPEIKEKYYYAINKMIVKGSCFCNGHASSCKPKLGQPFIPGMVYSECDCKHNTKGSNCEFCEDLYQDVPWQSSNGKNIHLCKRCECNNHANSCKFNETVFKLNQNVSGGVCDCLHNTDGQHCEFCKTSFFKNSSLSIMDPNACELCKCDERGSLNDGICDNRDDIKQNLVSGKCYCKENVEGMKCDRCKVGFWNLTKENPQGCQRCTCNTLGTKSNRGCDQINGTCDCKDNVIGNDCNKCKPYHYGIEETPEGCKPCNCDPGGSYDLQCNLQTHQCLCRPNVEGQYCDKPKKGYFAPFLDSFKVEGENTIASGDTKLEIREAQNVNDRSWTGNGFVSMKDNSNIEFEIKNEGSTAEFDVGVRYEMKTPRPIKLNLIIENIKKSPITEPNRTCQPIELYQKQYKTIILNPRERHSLSTDLPLCLASGSSTNFKLQLEPDHLNNLEDNKNVLIDSIFLYPRLEKIPVFSLGSNRKLQEFRHYQCELNQLTARKNYLHDICVRNLQSASFYIFNGAQACDCDKVGSLDNDCNSLGGKCKCKPNVIGRRCDKCAAGFHSLNINGCESCNCHNNGSRNNICDFKTGQCQCWENTYGIHCDLCQPGFWNYPNCERCNCNRHAEICDPRSGKCENCNENTDGHNCERCKVGYYGNPLLNYDISCRPCPCPNTPDSNIYHASGCVLDNISKAPICRCDVGYTSERCDRCENNYFGDPTAPGGECKKCNCNGNVDYRDFDVCDKHNGTCLKCLYNTVGSNCELCKPGFYGDALKKTCRPCTCNSLGTNTTDPADICDRHTGKCKCLTGVTGTFCDHCLENHWDFNSGKGCKPCDCDKSGSRNTQCNLYTGQCDCSDGYGGNKCNECQKDHYGDPKVQCYPCNCILPNSLYTQCHKTNGTCVCAKGIAGDKCDKCARGYTGQAPYCESCGECFENWDNIINGLKANTNRLIEAAKQINQTGLPGAYKDEFSKIESQLSEIEKIIAGANITELDVKSIEDMVANLRTTLSEIEKKLLDFHREIESTSEKLTDANLSLANLNNKVEELEKDMKKLRDNATALVEENVEGAYDLTKEAHRRSQTAKKQIQNSIPLLSQSEALRKTTIKLLDEASTHYNESRINNDGALSAIRRDIAALEMQIPAVNALVCDGNSTVYKCENMCGGAGCDKCGGISCENGATTIAGKALEMGRIAEEKLNDSKEKAISELNRILESRNKVDEAYRQAQLAYENVQSAKNKSDRMSGELKDLLVLIDKFLEESNAKPSAIRNLAEQCTVLQISLTPDQIIQLTRQINDTISSLTDIEKILNDTTKDLSHANSLRERADDAKSKADRMLNTAKQVLNSLEEAAAAQSKADQSIQETSAHIDTARNHLSIIDQETEKAESKAKEAQNDIFKLEERLNELKKRYTLNEYDVSKALEEAHAADQLAKEADKGAKVLENRFERAEQVLKEKEKESGNVKEQAETLKAKAMKLAEDASVKFSTLREIDDEFDENEKKLLDYSKMIEELNQKMKTYLDQIVKKAEFHRNCNP